MTDLVCTNIYKMNKSNMGDDESERDRTTIETYMNALREIAHLWYV